MDRRASPFPSSLPASLSRRCPDVAVVVVVVVVVGLDTYSS